MLLGTAGGGDPRGEILPFMTLGAVLALFGVGLFVLEVLPGLHALRDRSVRERRAGVLYAVGRSGLYVRTRSFELREPWKRVQVVAIGAKRVAIATADAVHVIPVALTGRNTWMNRMNGSETQALTLHLHSAGSGPGGAVFLDRHAEWPHPTGASARPRACSSPVYDRGAECREDRSSSSWARVT